MDKDEIKMDKTEIKKEDCLYNIEDICRCGASEHR